jgi:hypothetical protein
MVETLFLQIEETTVLWALRYLLSTMAKGEGAWKRQYIERPHP